VEYRGKHKSVYCDVVQRKKVSNKNQLVTHKKAPKQNSIKQCKTVKKTVTGEPKMKKNWKQKASKFAFNLLAGATFVFTLNAGMSVAP
jgi:hypothetical protein